MTLRRTPRFIVLAVVAAVAAAAVSPAVGGPSLLTLTKARKVFFTKQQSNARFLTKAGGYTRGAAEGRFLSPAEGDAAYLNQAEGDAAFLSPAEGNTAFLDQAEADAAFLDQAEADGLYLDQTEGDAAYLPRSGDIQVQVSPDSWVPGTGGGFVEPQTPEQGGGGLVRLRATGAATDVHFHAALTLPSLLQGRPVTIEGFSLCYSGIAAAATIDDVALHITQGAESGDVFPDAVTPVGDPTNRDDLACRTYTAGPPTTLGPLDFAQIVVRADYTGAAGIPIGRLTINLST